MTIYSLRSPQGYYPDYLGLRLGLLLLMATSGCQVSKEPATMPSRSRLHETLLTIAHANHTNDMLLNSMATSHLTQNVPQGLWLTIFPPNLDGARLLSEGKTLIVPNAKLIAEDPSEGMAVRELAADVYGYFDQPWYLRWLAAQNYPTDDAQFALYERLDDTLPSLPHPRELNYPHYDLTHKWLTAELQEYPAFDELILSRFDEIMVPNLPPQQGGLADKDIRLIQWFNRFNDVDMDTWLNEHAPGSAEYRQHTIEETGVDPLLAFGAFMQQSEREYTLLHVLPAEEAAKRLQLLDAVFPNSPDPDEPHLGSQNWREDIIAWYWEHRSEFKYDSALRRFVLLIGRRKRVITD